MSRPEPVKRIVLSSFWIGDEVYAVCDGTPGYILHVELQTDRLLPRYFVVFANNRDGEWCYDMELTLERTFKAEGDART